MLSLQPDFAAHGFYQRRLEIASPSPKPPNLRAWVEFGLDEFMEDILALLRPARPRRYRALRTAQEMTVFAWPFEHFHDDTDAALFGEFDGIAEQVRQHLAEADSRPMQLTRGTVRG